MAATVVVELTGDERRVLEAYRKAEEADKKLRESTGKTGDAAEAAGREFADAWTKAGKGAAAGLDVLLAQLRKTGPEGQAAAAAIEGHLREAGKAGRKSIDEILDSIGKLDPEAAAAAAAAGESIKAELEEAARKSDFQATLDAMKRLGPEGEKVARGIAQEMDKAAAQAKGSLDEMVAKLGEMDPAAAAAAERIQAELAEADAKTNFDRSIAELRKINPEAAKAAASVRDNMTAAQAEVEFDRIIEELRKIDPAAAEEAEKLRSTMNEVPKEAESSWKTFSKSAVAQVGSIAVAYLSVQQAIQTAIDLNRKVIETNKQVFDSLKETEGGDKRLLQVAESADDFTALRDRADQLATSFGLAREEARGLMFSARSEGFEDTAGFIAANRQVIDVQAQAGVAGQVPQLFKGEGITGEQVINATLAGAQASRLDFEDIGRSLPSAAEGAAMQGATASETIGSLSVLAGEFKSGETAADRIKALATAMSLDQGNEKLGRESLAGKGLIEGVEMLMTMTDEQRRDFLGTSQEVNVAFSKFSANLDEIKSRQNLISTAIATSGTAQSPVAQARAIAEADPKLAAQMRVAVSENRLEMAKENRRAIGEGNRQESMNTTLATAEQSGVSEFRIAAAEKAGEFFGGQAGVDLTAQIADEESGLSFAGRALSMAGMLALTQGASSSFFPPSTGEAASSSTELGEIRDLLRQQNALVAQQNALLQQTESNTRPGSPDYDAAFNASLDEQDAR